MMKLRLFLGHAILALCLWFPFDAGAQDINPGELKAKADRAVAIVQQWAAEGRDLSGILPKMRQVKTLAEAGKLAEADALLDKILATIDAENKALNDARKNERFVKDTAVNILGYDSDAMEAFISRDGRYMFFNNRAEADSNKDIYYAERIDDYRFRFRGEVAKVNTGAVDGVPSMDRNGDFYYMSTHAYRPGNLVTVYHGKFKNGAVKNIKPIPELSINKSGWLNMDIEISADGQTLYSTQTWFGDGSPPTRSYFFYARKIRGRFIPQADSPEIFKEINQDDVVYGAALSGDELEIFYTRLVNRDGAKKLQSLRATRPDKNSPFGQPQVIDAITGFSEAPTLSDDGRLLYYHKMVGGPGGRFKLRALHRRDRNR